jgi:hypothetical protein
MIDDGRDRPPGGASGEQQVSRHPRLKRVALAAATAFLAINIWTGAPLAALWVGSVVVGQARVSMAAVFVVVVVLAVLVSAMAVALVRISATYDRLIGRPSGERRLTWLRSVRAEGGKERIDHGVGITALERIVMVSVYAAVIVLLVWFFVFARSPLPS